MLNSFSVPLSPVAFFPLNGQYETTDISHSSNPAGQASDVELAPGPDGSTGGSYQFSGSSTSFISFPNNGGLDTRYSMTFLAWMYHELNAGPIFFYTGSGNGVRFMLNNGGRFIALLRSSNLTEIEGDVSHVLEQKTWHFVGFSYNYVSGELVLWINGTVHKKKVVDQPAELATQQTTVRIGATPGLDRHYKGRMSCVQLYNRVLSELEIEDAKQSCLTTGEKFHNIFLLYSL